METCPLLVWVTCWFSGCCSIGMATTGHLALFGVLLLFVFGLIVFYTDGIMVTASYNFDCMSLVHLFVLCMTWEQSSVLHAIPLHFLPDSHTLSPLLKGFKLVCSIVLSIIKFYCCLFLIFFSLFCSCDMLGSCGFNVYRSRVVGIVVLNFLLIRSSAGL